MSKDQQSNQNPLARSCFNQFPTFDRSSIQRSGNAARSALNNQFSYYNRPDVSWSDEERQKYLTEKRMFSKYKTSLCTDFIRTGHCEWGANCRFAHGYDELRVRPTPKNVKTVLCKNFERDGMCPYAGRCLFIHRKKSEKFLTPNDSIFNSDQNSSRFPDVGSKFKAKVEEICTKLDEINKESNL